MVLRVGKIGQIGKNLNSTQDRLLISIARSAEELTSGKGWPEGVLSLMEDLGKITKVSRVWIFQTIEIGENYVIQDYPFEWADEIGHAQLNLTRFKMFRSDTTHPVYQDMIQSRKKGEWQSVIVPQLPEGWLKEFLASQGILTMLTIPIMVDGQWWGTLGFDDCKREYKWSDVEIALLRTVSYLISNAVIRDRLSSKTQQFNILQNITESSPWELDLHDGHFWCSSDIIGENSDLCENIHMSLRDMLRLIHPKDARNLLNSYRNYLENPSGTFRVDLRVSSDCGMYVWVEVIGGFTKDSNGIPIKFAGIAIEIRKRKQREEELRLLASCDSLTGVWNKLSFEKEFSRLYRSSNSSSEHFALLLADLDFFKKINDKYGHKAGDNALQQFSHICSKHLRSSDSLSRIGGEEFAILLPKIDIQGARLVAERIRLQVEATPITHGAHSFHITVSFGCAAYSQETPLSQTAFFKKADKALYRAKREGRNLTRSATI